MIIHLRNLSSVLGIILLFHAITIHQQSFFVDEVEELSFTKGPIWKAIWMPDSMPPMFTLTLRGWLSFWQSDLSGRWLSACLGLASVVAVYVFVHAKTADGRVAMACTILFAFSPLQLYYAQLTRGYSLMTFWAILCIGFFLMAHGEYRRKVFWIAFIVTSVIGMYSHYYFAMIPMSLGIALGIDKAIGSNREIAWGWVLFGYLAMGFFTLPVLLFLKTDFQFQHDLREPRPLSLNALVYTCFSYFSGYALGPSQLQIRTQSARAVLWIAIPWLLLTTIVVVPLAYRGATQLMRLGMFVPIACLITVPFVLLGITGAVSGITYNPRFVVWMAFPIFIWLGFAVRGIASAGRLERVRVCACIIACLVIFAVANHHRHFDSRYTIEDTRSVARYLKMKTHGDWPIYVVSDYMSGPLSYYEKDLDFSELPIPGKHGIEFLSDEDLALAENTIRATQASRLQNAYWLVYSRPFHGDPQGLLLRHLLMNGLQWERAFAGVDLYRGEIYPR